MLIPKLRPRRSELLLAVLAGLALLWIVGCSIHESRDGGEKKVDISTPFGSMKVNTDVDVKDTGLPVYPGARRAPGTENDKDAANVNISSGTFGLKVVVVKFRSDDTPEKVLDFYRPKMKELGGKFLECKQTGFVTYSHSSGDEHELTCGKGEHEGSNIELKAGTPDQQHIVAVKPYGSGSEFALVYVQKHGKEGTL
jgi:hypothetical protein